MCDRTCPQPGWFWDLGAWGGLGARGDGGGSLCRAGGSGLGRGGGLRCALSPLWDGPLGVGAVRAGGPGGGLGLGRNWSSFYPDNIGQEWD